uniref:Putative ovule protein n=1 Tax=Solanum chacoense TaxID=4108 RepID=A0A0V0GZB3_SOLCH
MSCTDDAVILKRFIEKERIYDFLAGLNAKFDSVRVQILGKEDLPSLNETMAIIRTEKGWRSVMLETQINEGSTLVAKGTSSKESEVSQSESTIKPTGSYKPPFNKDNLYCTYCKKISAHPREMLETQW